MTERNTDSPALYAETVEMMACYAWGNPLAPGGSDTCESVTTCASLGLQPLPELGTKEIGVDVLLPVGSECGMKSVVTGRVAGVGRVIQTGMEGH